MIIIPVIKLPQVIVTPRGIYTIQQQVKKTLKFRNPISVST